MPNKRVVIGDDHPVFRGGLSQLIRQIYPDAEIVEAGTFNDVLEASRRGAPPVLIVIDLLFPGLDIETSLTAMRQEFPKSSLVIVSMLNDPRTIQTRTAGRRRSRPTRSLLERTSLMPHSC